MVTGVTLSSHQPSIQTPSISANDASKAAAVLASNLPWRFGGYACRLQSTMHSLRFSGRVRCQFVPVNKPLPAPTSMLSDGSSLVLCTDFRLFCVDDDNYSGGHVDLAFFHLASLQFVHESRMVLAFRCYEGDGYELLTTFKQPPLSHFVIDAPADVLQSVLGAVSHAANLISRARPEFELPVFEISEKSMSSKVCSDRTVSESAEALYFVVCELMELVPLPNLLRFIRTAFPLSSMGGPTLHLSRCLGAAPIPPSKLHRILVCMSLALRGCVGVLFDNVVAHSISLGEDGMAILTKLADPVHTVGIDVANCQLSQAGIEHLRYRLTCMQSPPALRALSLSYNDIGDLGIAALINTVVANQMPLEVLKIGLCGAGAKSVQALFQVLPKLHTLELSGISLTRQSAELLAAGLTTARSLSRISLSLDVAHLSLPLAAIKRSPIHTLVLRHSKIDENAALALASIISESTTLTNLVLSDSRLNRSRLEVIFKAIAANKNLQSLNLDIAENGLGQQLASALKSLGGKPMGCLKSLFAGRNQVSGASLGTFMSMLSQQMPNLETLSLDGPCHWSSALSRTSDGARIGKAVRWIPSLVSLSVRQFLSEKGSIALCESLSGDTGKCHLRSLDIGFNSFSSRGYVALASLMKASPALESIFVDGNNGQLDGLTLLVEAICENPSICYVGIENDLVELLSSSPVDGKYCYQRFLSSLAANQSRAVTSIKYPLFKVWRDVIHLNKLKPIGSSFFSQSQTTGSLPTCSRNSLFGTEIFRVETVVVPEYESAIPLVLSIMKQCLLSQNAHLSAGILRVAPGSIEAARVRSYIQHGVFPTDPQVDAVADCVKAWFRELPTRLLDVVPLSKLKLVDSPEDAAAVIADLPEPWYSTSLWLLDLCVWIASYSDENLMKPQSLAIIIAPNLISDQRMEPNDAIQALKCATSFWEKSIEARKGALIASVKKDATAGERREPSAETPLAPAETRTPETADVVRSEGAPQQQQQQHA